MSGWASWFGGGRKDSRESARDAIVDLRQQLLMLEKKEEFLNKKIEEELAKARANATSNKRCEWSCVIALVGERDKALPQRSVVVAVLIISGYRCVATEEGTRE